MADHCGYDVFQLSTETSVNSVSVHHENPLNVIFLAQLRSELMLSAILKPLECFEGLMSTYILSVLATLAKLAEQVVIFQNLS